MHWYLHYILCIGTGWLSRVLVLLSMYLVTPAGGVVTYKCCCRGLLIEHMYMYMHPSIQMGDVSLVTRAPMRLIQNQQD